MDETDDALSVIIPTLNEAQALPALLADLRAQRGVSLETLVCDGGSQDATPERARAAGARVLSALPGRGRQMNAGAAAATHPRLLFLHADTRLRDPDLLRRALIAFAAADASRCAGHFALRFADGSDRHRRLYRHMERKTRLNRPGTINGDQGLLIHRDFFHRLGGLDTRLPFLEDQRISREIVAHGRWLQLPGALETSARRFEREGPGARYFLMMIIMSAEYAGLEEFFARARDVYRLQGETGALAVAPFLDLVLSLGNDRPGFWLSMADFTLDNAWQAFFTLDELIGRPLTLPLYDRLQHRLPRRALRRVFAPLLRWLFNGPLRAQVHRHSAGEIPSL